MFCYGFDHSCYKCYWCHIISISCLLNFYFDINNLVRVLLGPPPNKQISQKTSHQSCFTLLNNPSNSTL